LITFRYHVVTLVAVFMAIGVGVLFGATFIDQNIVEGLEAAQVRLGRRNETLRSRIIELERQNEALNSFTVSARDRTVRGTLQDQPLVQLIVATAPGELREAIDQTLVAAGANVIGRVTLNEELDLQNEEVRRRLATALESASLQPGPLSELLVRQISGELLGQNPPVLSKLINDGLAAGQLAAPPLPDEGQPARTPLVIVVTGEVSRELNDRLVTPLAEALAAGPLVTAVVEAGTAEQVLAPLRDRPIQAVTVDTAETALSQALLATGLQAAMGGQFGSYGFGEGATTAIPPPPA
jgi:hypothetical protein